MKDVGVVLFGHTPRARFRKMFPDAPDDAEAPRRVCVNREPCADCAKWMEQGCILMSVDPVRSVSHDDPYRTGGWIVLREEAVRRMFDAQMVKHVLEARVAFIEDEAWDSLGLPRGDAAAVSP
jgi:hypothetical protein